MTAKEYLRQAQLLTSKIAEENEYIEQLREKSTSVGQSIMDESVRGSRNNDPLGSLVSEILDEIQRCERRIADDMVAITKIESAISAVRDNICRKLLRLHYIEGLQLCEVAEVLCYSDGYTYRLHPKALRMVTVPSGI